MDGLLSRLPTLFQSFTFGPVIPDKTAKIMRTFADLKPMTQAKTFSGFNILRMHVQNAFLGSEVIPLYRAKLLTLENVPNAPELPSY